MANRAITKKELMEKYSDYLLVEGKRPVNVYTFSTKNGIEEKDFYAYFGSFEAIEKEYLPYFFAQSLNLTQKIDSYEQMAAKEKLLNFYYIFFENLALNRSLILMLLQRQLTEQLPRLKPLHKSYINYIKTLDIQSIDLFDKAPEKLKTLHKKSQKEAFWLHFISVLKFWLHDESPDFEKTDIYIEKSVDTGFEFIDNPLMDKFIDLSKFLWKENFSLV